MKIIKIVIILSFFYTTSVYSDVKDCSVINKLSQEYAKCIADLAKQKGKEVKEKAKKKGKEVKEKAKKKGKEIKEKVAIRTRTTNTYSHLRLF